MQLKRRVKRARNASENGSVILGGTGVAAVDKVRKDICGMSVEFRTSGVLALYFYLDLLKWEVTVTLLIRFLQSKFYR